jgi:phosphoribosylformylglycinamidine cyclo-ligase
VIAGGIMGMTYKDSGVDIGRGNSFVEKIAPIVKSTFNNRVITDLGGFSALYSGTFPGIRDPVLVSGTDGVGTKIRIAQMMNRHDTIGIDAVAMCVNDILTSGATPLFFLDYIACGSLNEVVLVEVVKGIAEGCRIAGCCLVGGETAEHPSVMKPDDYDIAGFSVGVVEREKIINGKDIGKGDILIGLPSSGIHSNGFSLIRKLLLEIKKYSLMMKIEEYDETLGSILLKPTRIYTGGILNCIQSGVEIKGIVHITGGGFYENIPRILPDRGAVRIFRDSFEIPPIFNFIQREGSIAEREMFTTFNMGIGMIIVVSENNGSLTEEKLRESGETPRVIGDVIEYVDEKVKFV